MYAKLWSDEQKSHQATAKDKVAMQTEGIWNCSNNRMVQFALNNEKLREWGYPTFTEFYLKICEN